MMRICLVSHGFPPFERTGVENYTAALATAFARAGHTVEVFAPRTDPLQPDFAVRREVRAGFAVNWITVNRIPSGPRAMLEQPSIAAEFGRFLDREQPQVVHFQHLVKLGIGLIEKAREHGIPTLYTAHDYFPVCHRYTLLRPDLRHCDVRGDFMACGRCDLALGFLNEIESLGDYHMGALPEQLDESQREALDGILGDRPEAAGLTAGDVDAACDRRRVLDALRAQAFHGLDRIIAPTRFLADELVRGGIDSEMIEVLGYGVENGDLADLPAVRPDPSAPLRFGFFGGISKQKGVHVLVEAFRRAGVEAQLSIWGGSTDEPYVERMRAAAEEIGARWGGSFLREDLPRFMAETDVVVVPSIWVENQPLVIREAFSAGRPVVASRMGAIPESVRDGVDGLLFEPGDPDALAGVVRRLCRDPDLVGDLAAGIEPVTDVDRQACDLVERYEELSRARALAREHLELPASLRAFVGRYEDLAALPGRELFERSLHGLERLRSGLAPELGTAETVDVLLEGLDEGSRVQTLLRDTRREVDWLYQTTEGMEKGRVELFRAFQEIRGSFEDALDQLQTTEAALHSSEETVQERERQIAATEAQFRTTAELGLLALRTQQRLLSAELWPVLKNMAELTSEGVHGVDLPTEGAAPPELLVAFRGRIDALEGLRSELEWRRDLVAQLDQEATWRRDRMEELEKELEELRSVAGERHARVGSLQREVKKFARRAAEGAAKLMKQRDTATAQQTKLTAQEVELESQRGDLESQRAQLDTQLGELDVQRAQLESQLGELEVQRFELESQHAELNWRRVNMGRVQEILRRGWLGGLLRRTNVGRRIAGWNRAGEGESA